MSQLVGGIIVVFVILAALGLLFIIGSSAIVSINEFFDQRDPKEQRRLKELAKHEAWRRANPEMAREADAFFDAIDESDGRR